MSIDWDSYQRRRADGFLWILVGAVVMVAVVIIALEVVMPSREPVTIPACDEEDCYIA